MSPKQSNSFRSHSGNGRAALAGRLSGFGGPNLVEGQLVKYITKTNHDVLSHCRCTDQIAAGPAQLDCPWCGCGWLISCMKCRKAFTFGRVVDVDRSYADIVREDFASRVGNVDEEGVQHGAEWMAGAFADLSVGDTVAYLDGSYLPIGVTNFAYDGWRARHDFDRLPHAVALEQPDALREALGVKAYWDERELVDEGPDGDEADDKSEDAAED